MGDAVAAVERRVGRQPGGVQERVRQPGRMGEPQGADPDDLSGVLFGASPTTSAGRAAPAGPDLEDLTPLLFG